MSCTKERILAVEQILIHRGSCSMTEILSDLRKEYGIEADRKSIYDDIAALTRFLPIDTSGHGRGTRYIIRK